MSLAIPDMFIDVLTQSRDILILDRHEIDSVLNEQSLWSGGMVQEWWAKSTNLIDRTDIALYGSYLLEGSNVSVEVHAVDVTSRRVSAAVTYSGARNDLPKWVGKASADLLRQLREGYTGLESILRRIPQRSLACLEHFYSGQIAAEAGDRHRAMAHLLKASAMDASLAGGHYWLARTFESWEENDHAFLHYAAIGSSNINIRTVTVEMRDTYDRFFQAGITNWAFDALANCIRADPTWYDGIRTYLGRTKELPTGVPYINYLPATTSSVFGLVLPSNTNSTARAALRYPVDYDMWYEHYFYDFLPGTKETHEEIRRHLKDGIFHRKYPCFIFTAPPGYVIVGANLRQRLQMGWCIASLWNYSGCMQRGNVKSSTYQPKPGTVWRDTYQNFHWGGRFDRPYKAVFVTGADETVPAEVVFETVPESEVAIVDLDTGKRKMDSFWISWPDRFTHEKPPCFMYVNPGKMRFVVQGTWSEVGVDPTNNRPARVECYGNAVYDWVWSKGQIVRLDHSLHLATRRYTLIPEPTVYSADDQRLVDRYVTSGIGWRSIRTPNGSRPAVMSLVQPFRDTIIACWQPPLSSALPGSGTELLVTIFKEGMTDTEVRQVIAPELPVVRGLRLSFAPATEDYVLVCTPKDSTDATRDVCLRSHDLRTWTRCSVQSIAGEKLVGNDSATAAKLWELPELSPIRKRIGVESLGRAVCDYNSWFGDAVYCVEFLMGPQHALVCYRADAEVHRQKMAQRQAIQDAKDRATNRTHVEECRLAAKIAKEKGTHSAEFRTAVLKAAPGFRPVSIYTRPGEGTFQTYSLNDVRQGVDGFRFRMPKEPGLDFVWCCSLPKNTPWYIIPLDGQLKKGFDFWLTLPGEYNGITRQQDWLLFSQGLQSDRLEPGREYALWILFADTTPQLVPAGFAGIRAGLNFATRDTSNNTRPGRQYTMWFDATPTTRMEPAGVVDLAEISTFTCKDTVNNVAMEFRGLPAIAYITGFHPPVTNKQNLLEYAVAQTNIVMVRKALEQGATFTASPYTLVLATGSSDVKFLKELLAAGLSPKTWQTSRPLLWNPELPDPVRFLPYDSKTGQITALHRSRLSPEIAEFLVRECGADVNAVLNTQVEGSYSPLEYAARRGSVKTAVKLVELGATVTPRALEFARKRTPKGLGMAEAIEEASSKKSK
jgi:hypothetical protein